MNIVLVLAVVVGSCVCVAHPQYTHYNHHPRETSPNTTHPHTKGKETQVPAHTENIQTEVKVHVDQSEIQHNKTHIIKEDRKCYDIQRNTEARILDMNNRYPNRGKLRTLPGLVRLNQEGKPQINTTTTTTSIQSKDCNFLCPKAETLTPCTCDPCVRTINCSGVVSFKQLFDIFHTTIFPDPRFELFTLVSPLKDHHRITARSDTFLANTFGEASFTSIRVESMAALTAVEAGAFRGSEATLQSLVMRWNYGLTYFPFIEIGNMEVLQKLEVAGSSFTSLPVFPYTPELTYLLLDDNLINTIPPNTFTELTNLMYLDLAFNNLQDLREGSLHFSSQDLMLYLDHNSINYIDKYTFSGQQPVLLDVSCNALTALDQRVFQPILDNMIEHKYDTYVDATCNPLECTSLSWLLESMYLYFVSLPEPTCFPAS